VVNGIDIFRDRLGQYNDQFAIIGGTACSILFHKSNLEFRSTYDFDIVVIMETLNSSFAKAFWDFIHEGGYAIQERSSGIPVFYRFSRPSNDTFPRMIELFSRIPDGFHLYKNSELIPIHISDEVSSLSAILLDDDYYSFLKSGIAIVENLPVLKAEYLVPFKIKAWLDLTERKICGQAIDSKDIRKHRNDVFRIVPLLTFTKTIKVPDSIKADIESFLEKMRNETIELNRLGIPNRSLQSILELYSKLYLGKP